MALSKPKENDVMRELTSAKTVKDDVALLMAPYINFEHFLIPAPLSICVLGTYLHICFYRIHSEGYGSNVFTGVFLSTRGSHAVVAMTLNM